MFFALHLFECANDEEKKRKKKRKEECVCVGCLVRVHRSLHAVGWTTFRFRAQKWNRLVFVERQEFLPFWWRAATMTNSAPSRHKAHTHAIVPMTMQMENGLLFSIEICVNEFMHKLRANLLRSIQRRTLTSADLPSPLKDAYPCGSAREQLGIWWWNRYRQLIQLIAPSSDSTRNMNEWTNAWMNDPALLYSDLLASI